LRPRQPKAATEPLGELPALPDPELLHALLVAYQGLLDYVAGARRRARWPARLWAWVTEHYAIEYVRKSLVLLERRYATRAALARQCDEGGVEGRARLQEMKGALPPPPSRARPVLIGAAVLLVSQIVLSVMGSLLAPGAVQPYRNVSQQDRLREALSEAGDLSVGKVLEAFIVLGDTDLKVTAFVMLAVGIAAYLVLRPFASGAAAFRVLRDGSDKRRRTLWHTRERSRGNALALGAREQEVFGAIGLSAPSNPRVDLIVKACLAAPVLLLAAASWHRFLAGYGVGQPAYGRDMGYWIYGRLASDAWLAVIAGGLTTVRLVWLAQRHRRTERPEPRRSRRPLPYVVGLLALAGVMGLYKGSDVAPPNAALEVPRGADTDLRKHGSVHLRVGCDEPCGIASVVFLDSRGRTLEVARTEDHKILYRYPNSRQEISLPPDPSLAGEPTRMRSLPAMTVQVWPAESAVRAVRAGFRGGGALRVAITDSRGNTTQLFVCPSRSAAATPLRGCMSGYSWPPEPRNSFPVLVPDNR
jgi:hypothetical protein